LSQIFSSPYLRQLPEMGSFNTVGAEEIDFFV